MSVRTIIIDDERLARNELKKLLQDVAPALKAHLAHAEMVQKMFSKK